MKTVFDMGERKGWRPSRTSEFERDRVQRGVSAPYGHGIPLVVASLDYLDGVAMLLGGEGHIWAPYPVARSCLETASRAWWMLDPDEPTGIRNARAYELLRVAIYANRAASDSFARQRRGYERHLISELAKHEIEHTVRDGRVVSIGHAQLPGFFQLAVDVLGDPEFGADAYGWLSGVGHGGVDVLREAMTDRAIDTERSRIVFEARPADVSVAAYCASTATLKMFDRWVQLCSWESDWERWSRHFRQRSGQLLADTLKRQV